MRGRLELFKPFVLCFVRALTGMMFTMHGLLIFHLIHNPNPPAGHHVRHGPDLHIAAGVLEVGGGILVALGLFTRPTAFLLSGEMAVAYFLEHAPENFWPLFNGGDAAVLYCFLFLIFVFTGPGRLSLDALITRKAPTVRNAAHT